MQVGWTSREGTGGLGRYQCLQTLMPCLPTSLHPWLSSLPVVTRLPAGALWGLGVGTLPVLLGKKGWILSETRTPWVGKGLRPPGRAVGQGLQEAGCGVLSDQHLLRPLGSALCIFIASAVSLFQADKGKLEWLLRPHSSRWQS